MFLCTFLQLILSCNAAFIHCVNYFVCPVDPGKLMMSNVYTVFFICDVYLSKVSKNETETVDLSVCLLYLSLETVQSKTQHTYKQQERVGRTNEVSFLPYCNHNSY